jgi:phosphoribosylformylglycinamidine synthase
MYPLNPDRTGDVPFLMPRPENHIFPWQHPAWRRAERRVNGLRLFEKMVKNA